MCSTKSAADQTLENAGPAPAADPTSEIVLAGVSGGRVLIVEDDERSGRLLEAHLLAAGYTTTITMDAKRAQAVAERDSFDLILCDVCLPDVDGIELTSWFRAQPDTAHIPVLLITSSDDSKVLSRGMEAGADDFLTKPVNSNELRARVRSLLRSQVLVEELRAQEEAVTPFERRLGTLRENFTAAGAQAASNDDLAGAKILIVEDNESEARLLEAYVNESGHTIRRAVDVQSALAALEVEVPTLVILDLILPDKSGYHLIEKLKSDSRWDRIPILVVSAMAEVPDRVRALECGADDFILKGFERVEFEARVRRLLRVKQHLDQLSARCNQALRAAITDSLTGLYTHGFLQESVQRQVACARRHGRPISLLFADVDHFKQINDHYGHSAGDEVLKSLAQTFRETMRSGDILVRYGGEEFVVLLPHTGRADAADLAERLRNTIQSRPIPILDAEQRELCVTMSIGVAAFPDDAADSATLIEHADEAMYLAKQAGRNRVAVFGASASVDADTRCLLLVDDDEKNLRLLQAYLVPQGYRTLVAHDGQEAIEVARRSHPDLILLDAMMPRMSGFDACRRLKQELATRLIPVVIVTALGSRDDRLRGIEAGADDFLRKPIDKVELLARIRALLRTKSTTDLLEDAETVIFTLARAVEARDPSTGDHVERVSRYAAALGKAVGIRGPQLEGLRRAGVVHDIGKVVVPDSILLKPGKLTPEERSIMEQHVEAGYDLLRPLRTFSESLEAVRYHHERIDGSGYPFGLKGTQVPLAAQIMGVVDVYDALTCDRVYRKALSSDDAAVLLRGEAARGLHDSELVEAFLEAVMGQPVLA